MNASYSVKSVSKPWKIEAYRYGNNFGKITWHMRTYLLDRDSLNYAI